MQSWGVWVHRRTWGALTFLHQGKGGWSVSSKPWTILRPHLAAIWFDYLLLSTRRIYCRLVSESCFSLHPTEVARSLTWWMSSREAGAVAGDGACPVDDVMPMIGVLQPWQVMPDSSTHRLFFIIVKDLLWSGKMCFWTKGTRWLIRHRSPTGRQQSPRKTTTIRRVTTQIACWVAPHAAPEAGVEGGGGVHHLGALIVTWVSVGNQACLALGHHLGTGSSNTKSVYAKVLLHVGGSCAYRACAQRYAPPLTFTKTKTWRTHSGSCTCNQTVKESVVSDWAPEADNTSCLRTLLATGCH